MDRWTDLPTLCLFNALNEMTI